MNWEKDFLEACQKYNAEVLTRKDELMFITSVEMDEESQEEIKQFFPDIKVIFSVGLRQSTIECIESILSSAKKANKALIKSISFDTDPIEIEIIGQDEIAFNTTLMFLIDKILVTDPYSMLKGWKVTLNSITLIEKNPEKVSVILPTVKKDTAITEDDILNLQITLNNCNTIDDFINSI